MPRIFAFIVHKAGVPDDTALELAAAARKLDAAQSPLCVALQGEDGDVAAQIHAMLALPLSGNGPSSLAKGSGQWRGTALGDGHRPV